ncbi:MAG: YgjV family protein [Spirochaetes bacterium]|nr:YgjV family protein [Spirochaetota bacterium]MBN2771010.1 YgjV family protein [Spirochaetota bacterium]
MFIDWIGYFASVLIALSLMMSSHIKLRWLNMAGAFTMVVYGILIESLPIILVNAFIIFTNIYYLLQLYRTKTYLKILQTNGESAYLKYFIDYYKDDIRKNFPEFDFKISKKDLLYFLIRDCSVTGLLVLRPSGRKLVVRLDYVTVGYRDLKLAWYLYYTWSRNLQCCGYTHFVYRVKSEIHYRYLKKMGFRQNGKLSGSEYELPVGLIRLNHDS